MSEGGPSRKNEPVWDDRLLTRQRALELVGTWPIVLVPYAGEQSIHVHCSRPPNSGATESRKACYQSVARLLPGYRTTIEDILSGVLRHAVTAHNLDTGRRNGKSQATARSSVISSGACDLHPGDRPLDQTEPPRGGGELEGGAAA